MGRLQVEQDLDGKVYLIFAFEVTTTPTIQLVHHRPYVRFILTNKLLLYQTSAILLYYCLFLHSRRSAISQNLFERRLVAIQHRLYAEMLVYIFPAATMIYVVQPASLYRRDHLVPFTGADQNAYLAV